MHYTAAHILFSGFTQRRGCLGNGIEHLLDLLTWKLAKPTTLIELVPWYISPESIAARLVKLWRNCYRITGEPMRIHLIGYSFGGQTAANVAGLLEHEHAAVDCLTLCDPVRRRGRLWWASAFNPWASIEITANVQRVTWFEQRKRWLKEWPVCSPIGHRVELANGNAATTLEPVRHLSHCNHLTIDNAAAFHRAAVLNSKLIERASA